MKMKKIHKFSLVLFSFLMTTNIANADANYDATLKNMGQHFDTQCSQAVIAAADNEVKRKQAFSQEVLNTINHSFEQIASTIGSELDSCIGSITPTIGAVNQIPGASQIAGNIANMGASQIRQACSAFSTKINEQIKSATQNAVFGPKLNGIAGQIFGQPKIGATIQ